MKNFEIAINERVIEAINAILSSGLALNKADLAEKFGIKPAKFSEILNKRMKAGMDIIQNLCIEYGISADWLITGNGMMLREEQISDESPPDQAEVIRMLKEKIHDQQEIITLLKEKIDVLQGGTSES
jgi:transcriptional regulator with XRE-family HTH domain